MSKDTRNVGLAFLVSTLLVVSVALAADLFLATQVSETACFQAYTLACAL